MHPERHTLFISVRPRFAELLLNGTKTVELRRLRPAVGIGSPVLLYASSPTCALLGTGKIGEVQVGTQDDIWLRHGARTGLSRDEYDDYFRDSARAIAIVLARIRRLTRPVPLRELRHGREWFRPPQSFRYLNAQQAESFEVHLGRPVPASA
jgi:predicted transcriptional regulator